MNDIPTVLIILFILINLGAFLVMLVDKNKSRVSGDRKSTV